MLLFLHHHNLLFIAILSVLALIVPPMGTQPAPQRPTACTDQMFNLYLAKGMPSSVSPRPTIQYMTGFINPGNISYVSALIQFGFAASEYQKILTPSRQFVVPVSYFSFDIPLCATNVTAVCVDYSEAGITGKTNCTNILDQDMGFPSLLAGRLFVHLDYVSLFCPSRIVNVTFLNTALLDGEFTSRYVYDVTGITQSLNASTLSSPLPLNITPSRNQYLTSGCEYSDGTSLSFALEQKQLVCVDKTIGCPSLNQITAVAPADFAVVLRPCDANRRSVCVPLNGSASTQTGTGPLYYRWRVVLGFNVTEQVFDSVTCNDYVSGLFNASSPIACIIFRYSGYYQVNLTVFDNVSAIATDSVFINVVMEGDPLVIPNTTITPYPLPQPKTFAPIARPPVNFGTPPPILITEPPVQPKPFVNTSVPSLLNQLPSPTSGEIASVLIFLTLCSILFVVFSGMYIALLPSENRSYMDRIYYR